MDVIFKVSFIFGAVANFFGYLLRKSVAKLTKVVYELNTKKIDFYSYY